MEHLADEFVDQRERRGEIGRGKRVSLDLRQLAVRYRHWAEAQGENIVDSAERLGLAPATLDRWLSHVRSDVPALREVVVRDDGRIDSEMPNNLALVTPEGFRIEGLMLTDLPTLLASLR